MFITKFFMVRRVKIKVSNTYPVITMSSLILFCVIVLSLGRLKAGDNDIVFFSKKNDEKVVFLFPYGLHSDMIDIHYMSDEIVILPQ